ncbi:Putative signal transducing protein [Flaviramulus basaltis]|uniref:Putative signal transducing protein n=1 Tax=Flaviramulus basaltis TaxID=369401 RepID=A0A1K2ITF5_9FLAO|nr:DUF2007 domain-containing protein [Flaviramulus basaltis]SFZ95003.1 Putative signal transducing protein [Flaviramulus basaltis]
MQDSNYIKIYTGDFLMVQRIVSELEKENIIPVLKDQTDSGLIPIFGTSNAVFQQVFVHKDELDKAVLVVENIISELQN